MSAKPTINDRQEVQNWINSGKGSDSGCMFHVRPAAVRKGRSSPGEWVVISNANQIPTGKKLLLKRSSDGASLYVEISDNKMVPLNAEPEEGTILREQDAQIANGIATLNALDAAVDTTMKAIHMAKESMETLESQRAELNLAAEDRAKAELYRGVGLAIQRGLDMLSVWRRSPEGYENKKEFEKYMNLKTHMITQAGVDLEEVSASDLAVMVSLMKDKEMRNLINQVKKAKIERLHSGAESVSSDTNEG